MGQRWSGAGVSCVCSVCFVRFLLVIRCTQAVALAMAMACWHSRSSVVSRAMCASGWLVF